MSLYTYLPMKMEQSVPKRPHMKFRRRGITQKKTYNTYRIVCIENCYDLDCPWLEPRWGQQIFLFLIPIPTDTGNYSSPSKMRTEARSRGKSGQDSALNTHSHLGPRLQLNRAIPLFLLSAITRCYRITCTFVISVFTPIICLTFNHHGSRMLDHD